MSKERRCEECKALKEVVRCARDQLYDFLNFPLLNTAQAFQNAICTLEGVHDRLVAALAKPEGKDVEEELATEHEIRRELVGALKEAVDAGKKFADSYIKTHLGRRSGKERQSSISNYPWVKRSCAALAKAKELEESHD